MATPRPITIDFETKGIKRRPDYPPVPVGFSLKLPNWKKSKYYGWGHPTKNNCTRREAMKALKMAWDDPAPKLFHNAKFDTDVAETHCGMKPLAPDQVHDTMLLLFLVDPHATTLSLKPAAEYWLDMPPEERDAVAEWIIEHQEELIANGLITQDEIGWTEKGNPKKINKNNFGAFIWTAPGDLVGAYADGDVIRTEALFKLLYPYIAEAGMLTPYLRERKLLPILLRNEREGINADLYRMLKDRKVFNKAMDDADNWLRKELRAPNLNIDSDEDLADQLDKHGIVTEWVYTAKSGQRSTAKKNMTVDKFNGKRGARVASVLGYRNRLATCVGTFLEPWIAMAEKSGGRIFTNWNQVRQDGEFGRKGTRTGRLSTNPNFQNIPKDFYDKNDGYVHPSFITSLPQLPYMRKYILPDKGHLFGHRDYNQQEYRILAHYEDGQLLQAYNEDPRLDIHTYIAGAIKETAGLDLGRRKTKTINFGILYGMGMDKLANDLGCTVEEAKFIKAAQRRAVPGLGDLEKGIKARGRDGDCIVTWGGRQYYTEEPRMVDGRMRTFEYKLLNYLIQGGAADCTKEAVIRYDEERKHGRFLVTVHDEINISAPRKAIKQELALLREVMASVEFDVPMISDAKYGPNWGELEKLKEAA